MGWRIDLSNVLSAYDWFVAAFALPGVMLAALPSFFCSSSRDDYEGNYNIAAAETQLMAARATPDCAAAAHGDLREITADGVLIALADKDRTDRTAEARRLLDCRDFSLGVICATKR